MAYTPTTWEDGKTEIIAARMNNIEAGVQEALQSDGSYTPTMWIDGKTEINAERMNNIEAGIQAALQSGGGGASNVVYGTFVGGDGVNVTADIGRADRPRAFMVWVNDGFDEATVDRYAPQVLACFMNTAAASAATTYVARYKSSSSSATTQSNTGGLFEGFMASSVPTSASAVTSNLRFWDGVVTFVCNDGNYRWRTGVEYGYVFIFD